MVIKVQKISLIVDKSIIPMTQSSTVTIVFISERRVTSFFQYVAVNLTLQAT